MNTPLFVRNLPPARSVFVNCPFDDRYQPILDAIVLASFSCGFFPLTALDVDIGSEPRMTRIWAIFTRCRYSIHDLSRATGEGDAGLARFNMPLELGMAMARRFLYAQQSVNDDHDWLVMVPDDNSYHAYVSDLNAYDLQRHDDTPRRVITEVKWWLKQRPNAHPVPPTATVAAAYPRFAEERAEMRLDSGGRTDWLASKDAALEALEAAAGG